MKTLRSEAATVATLLLAVVVGIQPLRSFDLFWHLATGRWIVTNGALPTADPFRFTSSGVPWIDHGWLSQLGLYGIERAFGTNGLVALGAATALLVASILIFAIRASGAPATVAASIAAVAIFGARPRFMVRPELATLLGLTILIACLQSYRKRPSWRRVATMAAGVALWANLHAGVVIAPVIAAAFLVGCRTPGATTASAPRGIRWVHVAAVPLVFATAILVNPSGAALYSVPIRIREALAGLPVVNPEWMRAWDGPWQGLACGVVALIAVLTAAAVRTRRIDPPTGMVAAVLTVMAVSAIRHQGLFFIGAAFAAGEAGRSLDSARHRFARWAPALLSLVLAVWCLHPPEQGIFRPRQLPLQAGIGLEPGLFPLDAARILGGRRDIGPVYNDVAFGGYLLWCLFPERQVFLDGRNEVDPEFLREVTTARQREDAWTKLLDRFGIDAALVQYRPDRWQVVPPDGPRRTDSEVRFRTASQVHFPRGRFALIHWDDAGMLFLRRTPERAAQLSAEEFHQVDPEDPESVLAAARVSPDARRAALDELDRRDGLFGPCRRSRQIRATLERLVE